MPRSKVTIKSSKFRVQSSNFVCLPARLFAAGRTPTTVFDSPCDIQQNKITPLSQGIFILAVPCGAWLTPPLQNLQVQTGVRPPAFLLRVEPQSRCSIPHVTYNKIKLPRCRRAFLFWQSQGESNPCSQNENLMS